MIVKEKLLKNTVETFTGKAIKITREVKRHLQAVTGNEAYKKSFTILLVDEWVEWLKSLTKIVESGPPKCKLSFCWGIYRKTNILYNKNSKFKEVRYDCRAHRSAHLFIIS